MPKIPLPVSLIFVSILVNDSPLACLCMGNMIFMHAIKSTPRYRLVRINVHIFETFLQNSNKLYDVLPPFGPMWTQQSYSVS